MAIILANLLKNLLFAPQSFFCFFAQNRARALRNDYKGGIGLMSRRKKSLRSMPGQSAFPNHHSESVPHASPGGAQARADTELVESRDKIFMIGW